MRVQIQRALRARFKILHPLCLGYRSAHQLYKKYLRPMTRWKREILRRAQDDSKK